MPSIKKFDPSQCLIDLGLRRFFLIEPTLFLLLLFFFLIELTLFLLSLIFFNRADFNGFFNVTLSNLTQR
jgi:hypothetical protein